jgi:GldH lipoprotein
LNEARELILTFRCASGYAYRNILINMTETDPQGQKSERLLDIPVKQENGEFYGEKGFDIIDIEYAIDLAKSFDKKGNWSYSFTQVMPNIESIDFPMELGLILRLPKNG